MTSADHSLPATSPPPVCPSCGRVEVPVAKYCGQCGAQLIPAQIALSNTETIVEQAVRDTARKIGSQLGRDIVRGVLGSITAGRKK
jgi:uncharacterized OB-fold protein